MGYFSNAGGGSGGGGGGSSSQASPFGPNPSKGGDPSTWVGSDAEAGIAVGLTANKIYYTPALIPSGTYTTVTAYFTSGSAGSTTRFGLYSIDPTTGGPGTLIQDFGTVDSSSSGHKDIVVDITLTDGHYWLAIIADISANLYQANGSGVTNRLLGIDGPVSTEILAFSKASQSLEHASLSATALSSLTKEKSYAPRFGFEV